ncbi:MULTISPECIES: hypothetical protein [Elizabethkingia]|nr:MULTISPECIES: hypothetical protein [Elizabethkingia]MDE5430715.1 hypothetical protein [Elizabethkingia meningoseptica]PKR31788.1 hypothetical protein CWH99_13735 [Elizabethkingia anophelis]PKR35578.1 hypothetical protein CWI00_00090 [Elizabethkingia anophelis]
MLTIERSIFPLAKIHVKVNDNDFVLGSNEVKTLDESNAEGNEYNIEARINWAGSKKKLILHPNSKIKIISSIPDLYYMFGGGIVFILCLLTFLNLIHPVLLGLINLVYIIPIVYYSFFNRKHYFKIYSE